MAVRCPDPQWVAVDEGTARAMRRVLGTRVIIGVIASGTTALGATGVCNIDSAAAAPPAPARHAATAGGSWSEHAVCPGTGITVDLVASHVATRPGPGGGQRVSGRVLATSSAGHTAHIALSYTAVSQAPGSAVVTGTAVEIAPGEGPVVVKGTAYLAPDGLLGRAVGVVTDLCTTLG